MENIKLQKMKNALPAILAVVLVYAIFHITGIGCPIRFVTGVSCPGCGMTRAWLSLLRFDLARAFYYHPLFLLPAVALVVYMFKARIPGKVYGIWMFTLIMLFSIIYLLRLLGPDDTVVAFRPQEGLIYRIIALVLRLLGLQT